MQDITKFIREQFRLITSKCKAVPQQVRSLVVLAFLLIAGFIVARNLFVPESFGKYGHYRADAVDLIISQEIKYAGQVECNECHDDIMEVKNDSYHRNLACETCHGPAKDHVESPDDVIPQAPRERGYCALCHSYNPSRPTGFPQIEVIKHNPLKPCMSCHDPHDPKPLHTPEECSACHRQITSTKAVSHHANLKCIQCHETTDEHKITPRVEKPTKPLSREFCGRCHAKDSDGDPDIPRIDISEHNLRYVCWQCHYPHHPEAHITSKP